MSDFIEHNFVITDKLKDYSKIDLVFSDVGNLTAKRLLIEKLREIGADGLVYPDLECGCGFDDFEPCDGCNLNECLPAKLNQDGLYYAMEIKE